MKDIPQPLAHGFVMTPSSKSKIPLSLEEADDCYRNALRRVATYLNSGKDRLCSQKWLKEEDNRLTRRFADLDLDQKLIAYRVSQHAEGTNGASRPPNNVRAEHEFYGRFDFQHRKNPHRVHVTFDSTEVFREWTLFQLHKPQAQLDSKLDLFFKDEKKGFSGALTNYLVKNFWHNATHRRIQDIHELNFHEFGGEARYESDFVADNLANIFLLRSYGSPVRARGAISPSNANNARFIFALNRCNRVFAERASQRNEELSPIEDFQERLWRFRRQLSNALSMELLTRGAGVTDIAIYFTGKIIERADTRGGYYHSGDVIVRLNQNYFNSGMAPYLENPSGANVTPARRDEIRTTLNTRISDIVHHAAMNYTSKIKSQKKLGDFAEKQLNAVEDLMCD